MNIIFLDVDGVLNSMPYFEKNKDKGHMEISDYHLQMLAKIYHTCDAKIVLSSSWRELDDESDIHVYWMYQYLIDELAKYDMEIISKTPVIDMNRPLEIKTWLNNRVDKEDIKFVSLDDDFTKDKYDEYGIGDCLVKTEFFCKDISEGGIQQRHVDKAIEILKGVTK
jgi:hypothetical protein